MAEMLRQHMGHTVQISGIVYPPGPIKEYLASAFFFLFIAGIIIMFAGEQIFNSLNFAPGQQLCRWMKENQGTVLAVVFLCNFISGQLMQTGAFEVFYNDQLVFSKLATGDLPNPQELVFLASKQMKQLPSNSY